MTISDQLPEVLEWLFKYDPLEVRAVEQRARLLFLDTLGCLITGLAKPEPSALAESLAGLDPGSVKLPNGPRMSIQSAAFIAGTAACWDEACEGLPRAHGRPGLHSFAAALPLGLAGGHTLGETLRSLVAGFELAGRLGECLRIRPGMHVDGTWGTFGAVMVAARLGGLTTKETISALQGAACHLPFSLYLPISQGATVRNTYVGDAARRGISAVLASRAGIYGPFGALEAFDELVLGSQDKEKRLEPAGVWLLLEGYLKPFAAARHVHYGAQAAIEWRSVNTDTAAINMLELAIYGEALTYCGNRAPLTAIQAQFSLAYGLAWTLVNGDLGPEAYFEDSLQNREVRRLESIVKLVEEPAFARNNRRAARLTVNGVVMSVEEVPGEPHLPLSRDEVTAKFVRYVDPILGSIRVRKAVDGILDGSLATGLADLFSAFDQ